jgi:hypothetical protein
MSDLTRKKLAWALVDAGCLLVGLSLLAMLPGCKTASVTLEGCYEKDGKKY